MKKILTITALALIANVTLAQENEMKNFRFGLKVTPSVNWYKPDGKLISGNGAGMKFGGGLILEFRLAKVASFQTGLQIDMDGGKVKYNNGGTAANASTMSYYYNIADDEIQEYNSAPSDSASVYTYNLSNTHYQLNERQYKATYITIPLMLKLKTKEIGTMTYFGQFGFNTSFRWKANVTDKVTVLPPSNGVGGTETKTKVDMTKDMSFFKASLAFGFGAEMNLSGTTSLVFGLNYDLGFTNAVKGSSDYIEKKTYGANTTIAPSYEKMPQVLKSNAVVLTVGVLF
ncbi:MAG: PorT family protein [Bacteroidetes bacterium]|nr:PorT family protein [Bacteroidota bacterium]